MKGGIGGDGEGGELVEEMRIPHCSVLVNTASPPAATVSPLVFFHSRAPQRHNGPVGGS